MSGQRKLVCPKTYRGKKVRASKGACQITLASGKTKRVKKIAAPARQRQTQRGATKSGCKPVHEGQIVTGSPSWDASKVARFRIARLTGKTGKTALITHVSGFNPLFGRTSARVKVGCAYGQTSLFLNPSGGRNSGVLLK